MVGILTTKSLFQPTLNEFTFHMMLQEREYACMRIGPVGKHFIYNNISFECDNIRVELSQLSCFNLILILTWL